MKAGEMATYKLALMLMQQVERDDEGRVILPVLSIQEYETLLLALGMATGVLTIETRRS